MLISEKMSLSNVLTKIDFFLGPISIYKSLQKLALAFLKACLLYTAQYFTLPESFCERHRYLFLRRDCCLPHTVIKFESGGKCSERFSLGTMFKYRQRPELDQQSASLNLVNFQTPAVLLKRKTKLSFS